MEKSPIAADTLAANEARFRQLFDQSNDAIVILDTGSRRVVDLNAEAENLFGYRRPALLAGDLFPLMDDAAQVAFSAALQGLGHENCQLDQLVMYRKDGARLFVSARLKLIALDSRQVIHCSFRDIADRMRLEEEARTLQAQLIQSDKMATLGMLVSGLAHEINNPTNYILLNSELLGRVWKATEPILEEFYRENGDFKLGAFSFSAMRPIVPKLFSGLVDGAERIRSIIEILKDFAHQDSGDTFASFDLNRVVAKAIGMLNHEIKKRCAHFYLEAGPGLPPALGNAQQIEQVIINLILNALQSLPDDGCRIHVRTSLGEGGERVLVEVVDGGEGMSPEVMARLGEPFFTTRAASGCSGLGLSISRSILRQNQGDVDFVSAPGEGTTATVTLRIFPAP